MLGYPKRLKPQRITVQGLLISPQKGFDGWCQYNKLI